MDPPSERYGTEPVERLYNPKKKFKNVTVSYKIYEILNPVQETLK